MNANEMQPNYSEANHELPDPDPLVGDWMQWVVRNIQKGVLESKLIDAASAEIRLAWKQRVEGMRHKSEQQGYSYETAPSPQRQSLTLDGRAISVLLDSERPRIVHYGNVLSQEECESFIALGQPKMTPSQTHDATTGKLVVRDFRSSNGTFLQRGETEFVSRIEQRLAALCQWPIDHAEVLQILQYQKGAEYRAHFDFFPPEDPTSSLALKDGGQRVATLIVYLNTVADGGETYFPKLDLKIKAIQGNALYFSYANAKNELDRRTLHGGAPVTQGEKWILTKWMRQEFRR